MQINWKYIGIWAALVGLSACESEELPRENTEAPCAVFHIESRAGETLKEEALRLFIADRREEHQLNEALHCGLNDESTEEGKCISIEKIVAQWYKFAFISVPDFANDETDGTKMFTVAKDVRRKLATSTSWWLIMRLSWSIRRQFPGRLLRRTCTCGVR